MPLEVIVLSKLAAGLEGLRQVAALMNPSLGVSLEFDDACVVFRDTDSRVVAVLQRPKHIEYCGDIPRCCDQQVDVPDSAQVLTEGFVPFRQARRGLEVLAAVAIAVEGQAFVKGVRE